MQPNTLTLNVDPANDSTIVAETFDRSDYYANRSTYFGVNHDAESRDQITLYRTYPTKSGNFKGVKKSALKFTRDFTVDGVDGVAQLTSPIIVDVSFSIPVGVTDAAVLAMRQLVVAALDSDTLMDDLNIKQMV